jgi:hypothetical protein
LTMETWTDADNLGEFEKATITHVNGIAALERERDRLREALSMLYDKWENGVPCHEAIDGQIDDDSTPIGNAVKLSFEEEQAILNLIVLKPVMGEEACANCGKPYRAHLLHDGNKCGPGTVTGWFPGKVAEALTPDKAN